MAIRTGRGYGKIHHPYQELYEGVRPSIQGLRAANFLPVAMLDKLHDDDPIVLLPGTFVGRLNTAASAVSTASTYTDAEEAARAVVPACWGDYTVTYGTHDTDFVTDAIDSDPTASGATAGASTATVSDVKPIGVLTAPVYSNLLKTKYTNYSRDLMPSVLMGNYSIVIPAVTVNERAIEPGDIVRVDGNGGTAATWIPTANSPLANSPGRLVAWDGNTGSAGYVVGRCVDKYRVGTIGSTLNATVKSKIGTETVSNQNADQQFNTLKRVQTVPGLGLSGSGTQGIPAMFEHATTDGNGDFFALVIKVDL
jgi:hypothetical protein